MSTVCFATKLWEGDWQMIVFNGFKNKREACEYPFDSTMLVINNVENTEYVKEASTGVSNTTVIVSDALNRIVSSFNLKEIPNVYASGELKAISACKEDYLCFVQGDCQTQGGDWITPGIDILEKEPDVLVVSPASDVNTWHDKEGYDHYMSDQAWIVRVKDLQNPEVYAVEGVDPDYPSYGGNSFEAMVGRYLKKTGKKRKILTNFWTNHPVCK